LGDQITEVVAVAVIGAGDRSVFVIPELQIAILLGQQRLLDQTLERQTDHLEKILSKEILEFGKVQLKMTVAEDLQFSHLGVPPL
jgi:hypothetical protein